MRNEAKLIKIGNSQGIRIPKSLILRYQLGEALVLEEKLNGILIRTKETKKLGWEETYQEMQESESEEWGDWQNLDIDENQHL